MIREVKCWFVEHKNWLDKIGHFKSKEEECQWEYDNTVLKGCAIYQDCTKCPYANITHFPF